MMITHLKLTNWKNFKSDRLLKLAQDIIPEGIARIGPGYNDALPKFVRNTRKPESARRCSPSLDKALRALNKISCKVTGVAHLSQSGGSEGDRRLGV